MTKTEFERVLKLFERVAKMHHEYTYPEIADAKLDELRAELVTMYKRALMRAPRVVIKQRRGGNRAYWQRKADKILGPRLVGTPEKESSVLTKGEP